MSSWKYITAIVFVLVGGALLFGYWALGQYNLVFETIDASNKQLAATLAASVKRAQIGLAAIATTTPDVSITFPAEGDKVFIGCNYEISWQLATSTSATTTPIKSLEIALADAKTRELIEQTESGLMATTSSQTGLEYLDWKVGKALPGEYYLLISKINDQETTEESGVFAIKKLAAKESCTTLAD